MDFRKYFQELKRRKVFKAAIAYLLVAWVIVQVATAVLPIFDTPPEVLKALVILLSLGFLVNLVFSWVYDVTPDGLRKTDEIPTTDQPSQIKVRRLNRVIIGFLSIAVIILLYNQFGRTQVASKKNTTKDSVVNTGDKSIAVLAFKNFSGDPKMDYISDGIADELTTSLIKIESLEKVIPFSEMLHYKGSNLGPAKLSDTLGVHYLLDGSVQISGDEIRIKVQLLDGKSNEYIWEDSMTERWDIGVFTIYDKVTRSVLERLNINLLSEADSIKPNSTNNFEAYKLYLKGRQQNLTFTQEGIKNAIPLLKDAVALDPNFTEAHYELGRAYYLSGLYWGLIPEQKAWNLSKKDLLMVLEGSNENIWYEKADLLLLWGSYFYEWDFEKVEKAYLEGKSFENLGLVHLYETTTGRHNEALESASALIIENPMRWDGYSAKSTSLYFLGRWQEANQVLSQNMDIFGNNSSYLQEMARWAYCLGNSELSKVALRQLELLSDDITPRILFLSAVHHFNEKDYVSVERDLEALRGAYQEEVSGSPAWHIALYYVHTGDYEKGISWLKRSCERHEVEIIWLREEPLLASIRKDPSYLEMYDKVAFPFPPLSVPEDAERAVQ
jgi:TolB-like protein